MPKYLAVLVFLLMNQLSMSQMLLSITSLPKNTPKNARIFMASSLNNWNPNDPKFEFKLNSTGNYVLSLPENSAGAEYKCTQGSWETVEGDAAGNALGNRKILNNNPQEIRILSWQKPVEKKNTAAENVTVLSDNFIVPQLGTTRKIWIYLPKDYATTTKRFPVIYMEDGQNLFNDATSFSGEWKVDETLNTLAETQKEAIVIGIENGGTDRLNEYSPWKNAQYGGGKGELYADFLAKTLKPFVDKTYRTLPQPKYTGLIGSSMGGLISFYTGLKYPEKFGRLGIFSPSFWFAKQDLEFFISKNSAKLKHTKFYFLAGKKESAEMVSDINEIVPMLMRNGVPEKNIVTKFDEDGTHSESYWSREFGQAFEWLFRD